MNCCHCLREQTLYPTRAYRNLDEPQVGDVVRMRHDDELHHGVSPSFDDSVIAYIDATRFEGKEVELARPHVYLSMDGGIDVRVERHRVPLPMFIERYSLLTTGKLGVSENRLQPLPPSFTVLVPWSDTPTKWHPTEKDGRFDPLTRGSFKTLQAAADWAVKHLEGQPYSIRYDDPMRDPELRAEYERITGHPIDLAHRAREAHGATA